MSPQPSHKTWLGIPANVWMVGLVTFLKNSSSVVLVIFCPFYLSHVLGLSMTHLGALEGGVEAASFFSRILSGTLSDSIRRRKPVLMMGYGLSWLARLFLSLSTSVTGIVFSRTCERLGNGIQASPRDALVGDFTTPHNRGACFGMRQTLTVSGSVLGAALAMWFMSASNNDYATLFWLTLIPSTLSIIVLALFVKDKVLQRKQNAPAFCWKKFLRDIRKDIVLLPLSFWKLTALSTLVALSNFGIYFLTERAHMLGLSTSHAPLIMIIQSLATALFAFPLGRLADRWGRRRMMVFGLVCLAAGDFGMAFIPTLWGIGVCVILWGLQLGVIINSISAYVTELVPEKIRGTGFGVLQFCNGLGTLAANILTGRLWERGGWWPFELPDLLGGLAGPKLAFGVAGLWPLLGLVLIPLFLPKRDETNRLAARRQGAHPPT